MRAVAANLQAKPKRGDDANDSGRIIAAKPDVIGLFEIGGRVRALFLKARFRLAGLRMWMSIPTPILWPPSWELVAKGKHHLSDRTPVGPAGPGPATLRAKDAPWVLLRDRAGRLHFVIVAHLAPAPQLNDARDELHGEQVDALAAKLAAVATENPGVTRHLLGDLNANDRSRLEPITALGLKLGRRTNDHGNRQLTYVASDLDGDRTLIRHLRSDHDAVCGDLEEAPMPTPRGFMPGAIIMNIPPGANDPGIIPVGGVFHVAVSEAKSLYPFFNGPSGGIESHFYVRRDGTKEQYRSIYFEADANYKGNSFMRDGRRCGLLSIETQGMGPGEWTDAQLAALKDIVLWANAEADVPIDVIKSWDGDGWGYHTMWGSPSQWTPSSKTCPGPDRIQQFKTVLAPWLNRGGKDPQPVTHVTKGRALVEQGLAELDKAKPERKGVDKMAAAIRAALDAGPEA